MAILLGNGANVNHRDKLGDTALFWAAQKADHLRVLELLLAYGADATMQDRHDQTPLHIAVFSKDERQVRALLKAGADYNVKNNSGKDPFEEALEDQKAGKLLLEFIIMPVSSQNDIFYFGVLNLTAWYLYYRAAHLNPGVVGRNAQREKEYFDVIQRLGASGWGTEADGHMAELAGLCHDCKLVNHLHTTPCTHPGAHPSLHTLFSEHADVNNGLPVLEQARQARTHLT
ncbi:uncharacterized protein MONBRDRAFT_11791 [Monosiga brevicollis MX1]|uniref:Uncharacterized protein n=1 Tax=Monosiga brevicollis TaxID=81824 RepID=A9VAA7_MONBE|nr:uncharacterized protein MONBRDRAFT_11791 [Monosiga brevicollis MX1]EDQ85453.1 predicted protein [Monosiga brevicollis MX1]|eukprot:XP_001749644.1 hypothetical protein [Monosiga brevicollis MX1]